MGSPGFAVLVVPVIHHADVFSSLRHAVASLRQKLPSVQRSYCCVSSFRRAGGKNLEIMYGAVGACHEVEENFSAEPDIAKDRRSAASRLWVHSCVTCWPDVGVCERLKQCRVHIAERCDGFEAERKNGILLITDFKDPGNKLPPEVGEAGVCCGGTALHTDVNQHTRLRIEAKVEWAPANRSAFGIAATDFAPSEGNFTFR